MLNLDAHINDICKKTTQKLSALSRITPYIDITEKRFLLNAFFMSQFSYCPLAYMGHRRSKNALPLSYEALNGYMLR